MNNTGAGVIDVTDDLKWTVTDYEEKRVCGLCGGFDVYCARWVHPDGTSDPIKATDMSRAILAAVGRESSVGYCTECGEVNLENETDYTIKERLM